MSDSLPPLLYEPSTGVVTFDSQRKRVSASRLLLVQYCVRVRSTGDCPTYDSERGTLARYSHSPAVLNLRHLGTVPKGPKWGIWPSVQLDGRAVT